MKAALPLVLIGTITCEAAVKGFHESVADQPHVENNLKLPGTLDQAQAQTTPPNPDSESLGRLRGQILYKKLRRANLNRKDKFALATAYIETARELMRLRKMEPWLREMQYNCLRADIELTTGRTRGIHDFSNALPAIAKALDIPYRLQAPILPKMV